MTFIAADVNELALGIFGLVVGITLVVTYLRLEAGQHRHRLLGGGPRPHRGAERLRHRGRLHVGRQLPRHRRADLPVRLRRLPVLGGLPGRLPHRAVPARRAHAQLGQVHDRRRALVPDERAAGALGRRARHAGRGGLLPDRADGRRGRADPGARRHRLRPCRDHHRRVHDRLHRGRRHACHHVGPDHQGRAADDGHDRPLALRARRRSAGTRSTCSRRHARSRPRGPTTSSRACSCRARSTRCRSASRSCSARRACRTS